MVVVGRDWFECLCTFGKCVMVLVARDRIEPSKNPHVAVSLPVYGIPQPRYVGSSYILRPLPFAMQSHEN